MCGIVGFLGKTGEKAALTALAERMSICLSHRGPDDAGVWVDERVGLALGHRRLSILDLSPMGHQPMVSGCGRYVTTFNGEIYNYLDLRAEVERSGPVQWRGRSDTEVILAAFSRWGIGPALERMTGMFALAVWDQADRVLHIARDRLGEKPLYYGWLDGTLVFGSELKAFRVHPEWKGEIDRRALVLFLRYGYVPAPYSIYTGIRKLWPGKVLSVRADGSSEEHPYWSAREVAERGITDPFEGTDAEARDTLETLLSRAVARQMVADVPLGAFLSGGIDSSTVVALMQAQSARPVQTFTIGFREPGHNEAEHAKAVARHLGTDHTELYVTPAEAMNVIPRLPQLYDEPFADPSQIPTFLVAQLARRKVTVSLSGDGGDELFGGYNRYFIGRGMWQRVGWLPSGARGLLAGAITTVSPSHWNRVLGAFMALAPSRLRYPNPGDKLHKLALVLGARDPDEVYLGLTSHWQQPSSVVLQGGDPGGLPGNGLGGAELSDFTQRMMFLDLIGYLPDDILVKVDRAAMGVSLETRVPMLDHQVVEFAWSLPLSMKIRGGQGKWLLRQVLDKYVPRDLIDRPKSGFDVPIGGWLRGPLRSWAELLLDERRLRQEGFFDAREVRTRWNEHLSGRRDWQQALWNVLMFQAWLEAENQEEHPARPANSYPASATSL
ncbi:MAG TPA: asparagine synthase (glutamine-hydrolyzing) [Gemmatimonadales bacterium]|nr:asparagine synthase (glutamine-hydrolyzing) [Gemmatimonadales bacterium]